MSEEINVSQITEEVKNANNNEELDTAIKRWFEKTRADGIKVGAQVICKHVFDIIQRHTKKEGKVTQRDLKRMTDEILKFVSVPLTQQNDSEDGDD